ncbi:hypothetical protein BH20ACT5_BH20ACT5_04320 [soil metagenome]
MRWPLTTLDPRLSRGELGTTAAATAVSVALYVRYGHPYLARGVIGDLLGFAVLGTVLVLHRQRLRHEALICLAGIGVLLLASPDWPLRYPSATWWAVVGLGLGGYLTARARLLPRQRR